MNEKPKAFLAALALVLANLALIALLGVGVFAISAQVRAQAPEPERIVWLSEVSGPPQGAEVYGFFELIYFYEGQGYRAHFFTQAQRDEFEREYLPTLGRVEGPRVDMSALPQDPMDAVGRKGK
ncbi:MAG: hypothetical protein PHS14_08265 [Elusimicrobia bacterium]|nr:hypothetical protein [Elusimicrobiota bacterium]